MLKLFPTIEVKYFLFFFVLESEWKAIISRANYSDQTAAWSPQMVVIVRESPQKCPSFRFWNYRIFCSSILHHFECRVRYVPLT